MKDPKWANGPIPPQLCKEGSSSREYKKESEVGKSELGASVSVCMHVGGGAGMSHSSSVVLAGFLAQCLPLKGPYHHAWQD